jgi:hypothetical protein
VPAVGLIVAAVVAAVVAVVIVAATARDSRRVLAGLVGITGGLQTAQIGGVHLFCLAVIAWALFGPLRDGWRASKPLVRLLPVICAAVLATTALTGTLVNSTSLAVQLVILAATASTFALLASGEDVRLAMRGLLLITTFASVTAILQYVGVLPHQLFEGDNRPIGIYVEPDWLGMFSAVGLLLAFYIRREAVRNVMVLVNLTALLLAAARGAWIAVLVVAIIGVIAGRLAPKGERPRGGWRLAGVAAGCGAILVTAIPDLLNFLVTRIEGVSNTGVDVSVMARQQQLASLLELEAAGPWNGLGLSAAGRVGVSGLITYIGTAANNVASNWILGWWVDGKLLAIPLILLFLAAATWRLTRVTGLLLAVVLVSSLFSNALLIPVAWLALALCLTRAGSDSPTDGKSIIPLVEPAKDRHIKPTLAGAQQPEERS